MRKKRLEINLWYLVFLNCLLFALAAMLILILVIKNDDKEILTITQNDETKESQTKEFDLEILYNVKALLEEDYLKQEDLKTEKLIDGMIKGMVNSLQDPYTVFLNEKETKLLSSNLASQLEGIGIEMTFEDDRPMIVSPLEGSPAQKAGLLPKDIIFMIDDEYVYTMSFPEIVSRIRGKRGTKVKLGVLRGEKENQKNRVYITVTRDVISVPSVEYKIYEDIGHIKIVSFSEKTLSEFDKAVKEIQKRKIDKVIVDVRYNPGGLFNVAVEIMDYFAPKGTIVVSERNGKGEKVEHKTDKDPKLHNADIVILQNAGTGSASEILAIALKDLLGVKIIGEDSFGKNVMQKWHSFNNGSSIKYTVAEWLSPKGKTIPDDGIKPDIVISDIKSTEEDEQLQRAIEYLRSR